RLARGLWEKEIRDTPCSDLRLLRVVECGAREFVETGLVSAPVGRPGEAVGGWRRAPGLRRGCGGCLALLKRCFGPFRQVAISPLCEVLPEGSASVDGVEKFPVRGVGRDIGAWRRDSPACVHDIAADGDEVVVVGNDDCAGLSG